MPFGTVVSLCFAENNFGRKTKNMMKKRLFALTCAALMGLSLTACGTVTPPPAPMRAAKPPWPPAWRTAC